MAKWSDLSNNGHLTAERKEELVGQVVRTIQGDDYPLAQLRDRKWLREKSIEITRNVASQSSFPVNTDNVLSISEMAVARVGGLGFLHELLPPVRNDFSEISVDAQGQVWLMPKDEVYFRLHDYRPSADEVWRAVDALLAHSGQAISRALPSVDAKLPRSAGMGGARIKVIHPSVAPGLGFPLFNIRLFEPKPVRIKQLLTWEVAPPKAFSLLHEAVLRNKRILIAGGTYTGKTTLLSALANSIPPQARIVKIEDPEEIWIDHPHVVSLEARLAPPGSDIPGYGIDDGVADAMRLSPRWLIVGEVRKGEAALPLFARMSGHSGMSTVHADDPGHAAQVLSMMLFNSNRIGFRGAKELFMGAIDIVAQLGWIKQSQRKLLGIWVVQKELSGGDVKFRNLWRSQYWDDRIKTDNVEEMQKVWAKIEQGEIKHDFSN